MWQYNNFYDDPNNVLMHSSHKYIDKEYKNGRWYYTYDEKAGGVRRKESSASKTNVAYQKDVNSLGLNLKARNKVLDGTVRTGNRATEGSKAGYARNKTVYNNWLKEKYEKNLDRYQKQNAKAAEKEHSDKTKSIDMKSERVRNDITKAAEKEHSDKTRTIDKKYERKRNIEKAGKEFDDTVKYLYDDIDKLNQLKKSKNPRQQDVDAAKKAIEDRMKELKKKHQVWDDVHEGYNREEEIKEDNTKTNVWNEAVWAYYNAVGVPTYDVRTGKRIK